jgi:hypothetical protein
MKAIIFFTAVIVAGSLGAQNWSPILVNEKMNYQHSDSSFITNTIWVDSVETVSADVIYYMNRIVKNVPDNPEIVLRNQPQFLLKQMGNEDEGIYNFSYPGEFTIKTLANLGENWTFDADNNITAEVTTVSIEVVFGVQDSVKIFSLSDGNDIQLSKSFGITKFPDFEINGYYELVGIQNTDYGESVPDFWDIFNFDVGDVFQYFEDAGDPYGSGYITRKITITTKELNSNSYSYGYDGIYYCVYWWAGGGGGTDSYTYSDNFNFTDSINHPVNYFCGQDYLLPNSYTSLGTNSVLTVARYDVNPETGVIYKLFGTKDETYTPYSADVFYEISLYSDTLYRLEYISLLAEPCGLMGLGYGGSLGEAFSSEGCFEYWSLKKLVGYIKDGDTVGNITPDSLLLIGINNLNDVNSEVLVYPNPADKTVNFQFKELNNITNNILIEIRNLQGQIYLQKSEVKNETITLDVENFTPGIFLYTIKSNEMMIQQGKLIIQ